MACRSVYYSHSNHNLHIQGKIKDKPWRGESLHTFPFFYQFFKNLQKKCRGVGAFSPPRFGLYYYPVESARPARIFLEPVETHDELKGLRVQGDHPPGGSRAEPWGFDFRFCFCHWARFKRSRSAFCFGATRPSSPKATRLSRNQPLWLRPCRAMIVNGVQ